jgi:ribosomal protein S27E
MRYLSRKVLERLAWLEPSAEVIAHVRGERSFAMNAAHAVGWLSSMKGRKSKRKGTFLGFERMRYCDECNGQAIVFGRMKTGGVLCGVCATDSDRFCACEGCGFYVETEATDNSQGLPLCNECARAADPIGPAGCAAWKHLGDCACGDC